MFLNLTGSIGTALTHLSNSTTGSLEMTLILIIILFISIALAFGIPLEFTSIIILPMLLSYMAYFQAFWSVGVIIFIYLAFILTKNWIFR